MSGHCEDATGCQRFPRFRHAGCFGGNDRLRGPVGLPLAAASPDRFRKVEIAERGNTQRPPSHGQLCPRGVYPDPQERNPPAPAHGLNDAVAAFPKTRPMRLCWVAKRPGSESASLLRPSPLSPAPLSSRSRMAAQWRRSRPRCTILWGAGNRICHPRRRRTWKAVSRNWRS